MSLNLTPPVRLSTMTAAGGKSTKIVPGVILWTPAWQECACGTREADYNESGTRRYYPCCQLTYLNDTISGTEQLIGIGRVWLNAKMRPKLKPSEEHTRAVVADCTPRPDGMTTALYRRYDCDRVLLYIGISDDLPSRAQWHERHSPWAQFVVERTTEWYASRAEAASAETNAIKSELPLFNKQHAAPGQLLAAAQYLLQGRRLPLVESEGIDLNFQK